MKNSKRSTRKPQTRLGGAVTSGLQSFETEAELEAALEAKMEGAGYRLTERGEGSAQALRGLGAA